MKTLTCAVVLAAACSYPKLGAVGNGDGGPGDGAKDGPGSGSGSGIDAGAVAWYHMNDSAGSAADATGLGNDAQLVGAQVNFVTTGWAAGALQTTGMNGHATAPPSSSLGVTRVTLEAWVYPNGLPNTHVVIAKGSDFQLGFDGGAHANVKLTLASGATVTLSSSTAVTMAVWTHLAATWDGTTASIYVNGILERTMTPAAGGPLQATSSPLDLGPSFPGFLDEVRVFGLARSAAQVLDDATLVVHFALDETSGTAVHDSSGNARDLVLTVPNWQTGIVGNALGCDGSTVFASMPSDPGMSNPGPMTIEAWVNGIAQTTPISGANIVAVKLQGGGASAPTAYGLLRCCNTGAANLFFHTNGPNSAQSADSPTANGILNNQWHHFAGTYNGQQLCSYVDGGFLGCFGGFTSLGTGAGPFLLCGSDAMSFAFTGLVDEVRVYTRELAADEIRAQFINP